jgi:hypothetical protein
MCDKRKRLPIIGRPKSFKPSYICVLCGIGDMTPNRLCKPRKS